MRRRWFVGLAAALGGCSVLPSQPYVERRDWPLLVRRPGGSRAVSGRRVLQVRSVTAAPGLERRGIQSLRPDGSLEVAYYEQWAVPPAQAVEDGLRRWLADSGLFVAVTGEGSRVAADWVLEGELTALIAEPSRGVAVASVALVLVDLRRDPVRVLVQRTVRSEVPLAGDGAPVVVAALGAAVAAVMAETERVVAGAGR